MKLKNIFLSFYLFFSMCICAFASENNKNRNIESRYKTITYDVFGGIMYSSGFNKFEEISSSFMPTKTHSLFILLVLIYMYEVIMIKLQRDIKNLITPMFGIQFDYNIWNKSNNNNYFSLKNNFNLLVRLVVLFKLKFDTNAKLYLIAGIGNSILKNSDISYIMNIKTNEFKNKSTAICGVFGVGFDLVIKKHFLLGLEYRAIPFLSENIDIGFDKTEMQNNLRSFPLSIVMHSLSIKTGLSF